MWGADREAETGERCGEQAEKQKQRRGAGSRQISKNRGWCAEQAEKQGRDVGSRQGRRGGVCRAGRVTETGEGCENQAEKQKQGK